MRAMAAPSPEGSSPWHPDLPASGSAGLQRGPASLPARNPVTPWLWLPLALSSMLLVLFVVVVNRQQAQAQRIAALLSRVQDLEHSRALERTAVLEQQLRSMLERLQDLEKGNKQQEQLARQQQTLQQELQQLRSVAARSLSPLDPAPASEPLPRAPRQLRSDSPASP